MAKTPPRRKQKQTRETNWMVIGGLILVGLLVFGGLIYLALRQTEAAPVQTLAEYCSDNDERCISIGDETAPVTLVEVSDFGCVHCQSFHAETATPLKEQYVDTGDVHWVVLPYALSASTVPAAASGMCANEQGNFFDYANALFAIEPATTRLTADGFRQAADSAGLDMDQFVSCMNDGQYLNIISSNQAAARAVGVTGTPTFFLNDEEVSGAQPLAVFAQAIESLLSAQ